MMWGELFYCKFSTECVCRRIFTIGQYLAQIWTKAVAPFYGRRCTLLISNERPEHTHWMRCLTDTRPHKLTQLQTLKLWSPRWDKWLAMRKLLNQRMAISFSFSSHPRYRCFADLMYNNVIIYRFALTLQTPVYRHTTVTIYNHIRMRWQLTNRNY